MAFDKRNLLTMLRGATLCAYAFVLFYVLPLAAGTWAGWGEYLKLTVWDAIALTGIALLSVVEMLHASFRILKEKQ